MLHDYALTFDSSEDNQGKICCNVQVARCLEPLVGSSGKEGIRREGGREGEKGRGGEGREGKKGGREGRGGEGRGGEGREEEMAPHTTIYIRTHGSQIRHVN